MSATTSYRWRRGRLELIDDCDAAEVTLHAADSWLVEDGRMLAHGLHRERFARAVAEAPLDPPLPVDELSAFWDAAIATIPREGAVFPRVELRTIRAAPELRLLVREAPPRQRGIRLATHTGRDPRSRPTIKGPDLEAMMRLRGEAQDLGADEFVLLSPDGYIAEGNSTALCWWVGELLAFPADDLPRVDSVTARALRGLAAATGVEVVADHVTPGELDGCELWAVNALHGIRVVTAWQDGPAVAELPGRAQLWRDRLDRLRRPLPDAGA